MSGTISGGRKAAKTNKETYGNDFYVKIGAKGGKISRGGHFTDKTIGEDGLTVAQRCGSKGGKARARKVAK